MKKSLVMLTGAALLLSVTASAKMRITKYAITIDEPVTAENTAKALSEFQSKGGKNPSITLSQCDDAGLAAAAKTFSFATKLTIQRSPNLKSLEPLKTLPLATLTLKFLPQVADLSPIGSIKTLTQLTIEQVKFANADLSFCAGLNSLRHFSLTEFPASLKSISGIEKCSRMSTLSISHNNGPLDLSPLADFKQLRSLRLPYVTALDLTPVSKMPALTDLSLYAAKNLDLAPLAACPKLKSIMIYATKGVKDYNDLAKIKTLETVNAGLTPMNDLSWAPQLPNLKKLDLFAESFKSFAPLAQCQKLENLTFWSMRGTVDVAQFADGVAPLKKLSFSGSTVVNEAKLAALAKNGKLIALNLEEVNKGKKPIDLSFLPALTTLQDLNIRKASVANMEAIAKLPNLKKVNADKSQQAKLESLLKNVKVSAY